MPRRPHAGRALLLVAVLAVPPVACARERDADRAPTLSVWAAASLGRPVRAALDSFTARTGVGTRLELQSSLELARRITELGEVPDVLLLADRAVFPALLAPRHVDRWTLFARNRVVVAWGARSRHAGEFARADRWWEILERPGVEVGRADPATDPSGYRTLLVFQLAERHYARPGLAARLLAAAPPRNVRPREADQIALVETGELDYVWTYENLARAAGLPYRTLPPAVDLASIADSATYATASVRVPGRRLGDSTTFRGEPIAYALAIPREAAHSAGAARLVAYLLSADGRRVLRAQALDVLDSAVTVTAPPAP